MDMIRPMPPTRITEWMTLRVLAAIRAVVSSSIAMPAFFVYPSFP
jgi:hypothetical protein